MDIYETVANDWFSKFVLLLIKQISEIWMTRKAKVTLSEKNIAIVTAVEKISNWSVIPRKIPQTTSESMANQNIFNSFSYRKTYVWTSEG